MAQAGKAARDVAKAGAKLRASASAAGWVFFGGWVRAAPEAVLLAGAPWPGCGGFQGNCESGRDWSADRLACVSSL